MSNTPKPKRRDETVPFVIEGGRPREIVVGKTEVPSHRSSVSLKPRDPLHELPSRSFERGELVVDFFHNVQETFVVKKGRLALSFLDSRGEALLKGFHQEVLPGQILFEELLTLEGGQGVVSDYRVIAIEETETYVLTADDVAKRSLDPSTRTFLHLVLNAAAGQTNRARKLQVRHYEDEQAVLVALDEACEQAMSYEKRCKLLDQAVEALKEQNQRLTRDVVNEAVLKEMRRLTTANQQLVAEKRDLDRRAREAEGAYNSQLSLLKSITDEVEEYERLRDLLGLETTDPVRLIEELRRIFLTLYQLKEPTLQGIGLAGLGGLSRLGVSVEELNELTEEEIEDVVSELPPPGEGPGPTD